MWQVPNELERRNRNRTIPPNRTISNSNETILDTADRNELELELERSDPTDRIELESKRSSMATTLTNSLELERSDANDPLLDTAGRLERNDPIPPTTSILDKRLDSTGPKNPSLGFCKIKKYLQTGTIIEFCTFCHCSGWILTDVTVWGLTARLPRYLSGR